MASLIQHSVSEGTLRAYGSAIEKYVSWCESQQLSPLPQHADGIQLAEFLAHLSATTQLKANTIGTYRSAVSSWASRGTLSDEVKLGQTTAVSTVMAGIVSQRRANEVAIKAQKRASEPPLTPAMLELIRTVAQGSEPDRLLIIAAAYTALYGLLRPSEFLGQVGKRSERALRASQITFFEDDAGLIRTAPDPERAHSVTSTPHHYTITLGATKADQTGSNPPVIVAAQPAVKALWIWMWWLGTLRPASEFVFIDLQTRKFLSCSRLCDALTQYGHRAGVLKPGEYIVGRSFRRGGAAGALLSGASIPEVQAAGRWRSGSMPALYGGAAAMQAHRMHVSRGMAPPASRVDRT